MEENRAQQAQEQLKTPNIRSLVIEAASKGDQAARESRAERRYVKIK